MQFDVEDPRAVDAFAAHIQEQFPELNVVINNAGISKPEELTADTFDLSVARSMHVVSDPDPSHGELGLIEVKPGSGPRRTSIFPRCHPLI
jgi:hypothetical protein